MAYSAIEDAVVLMISFYMTSKKFTEIVKEDCLIYKNNDLTIPNRPTYHFVTVWPESASVFRSSARSVDLQTRNFHTVYCLLVRPPLLSCHFKQSAMSLLVQPVGIDPLSPGL